MALQKLEEVFRETQERLKQLPHHNNFCQDYLPPNTTYTRNEYLNREIGKMIIKQTGQKLFIPMPIYYKLLSPIAETNKEIDKDTGLLYVEIQTSGIYPLNSEEMIALGTIAQFLDN